MLILTTQYSTSGTIRIQDEIVRRIAGDFLPNVWGWILAVAVVVGYAVIQVRTAQARAARGLLAKPIAVIVLQVGGLAVVTGAAVWYANKDRGVPVSSLILLLLLLFWSFIASKTRFGRHVYAVGGNAEAARRAGISVDRIRILVFMISGLMAGVGGVMLASRLRSVATSSGGGNLLLNVIAAAVIGGTSLFGGTGRVVSALLGALVIASIANGMGLLNLAQGPQAVITGFVLLAAVLVDALSKRRRAARGLEVTRLATAVLLLLAACSSASPVADDSASNESTAGDVRLVDVAADVGLDFRHGVFRWGVSDDPAAMMGGGLCWLDYDGDGWLDLYVVNSHSEDEAARWEDEGALPRNALFHNDGGGFVDATDGSGAGVAVRGTGCVAADLDLDGHTDLYVTTATTGVLLWNNGDGTFREGAAEAGVDAPGWYAGAAVGDVNRDGWPDLFLAGYASLGSPIEGATLGFPNTYSGVRDLLYLSEGAGRGGGVTFKEVGREAGLEVVGFEYGLGALFSDLDVDGDLDLYVANDTKPNRLYDNVAWPGGAAADPAGLGFRFEELAARAGVADPNAGMGVAGADFDLDGRCDLFVTNARGQVHGVFRSLPPTESSLVDPSYVDVRDEVGPDLGGATGWGVSWSDLDLDTDLDVIVANGDIPVTDLDADADTVDAFVNLAADGRPGRFRDGSDRLGLGDVGRIVGRGSAAADFDNDGDLDVAVNNIGGPLVLLENTGAAGHWLEIALDSFAPGAMVTVELSDGRRLVREVQAGGSYLSSEDPRAHFGLGSAGRVAEVTVLWPGGATTRMTDVAADRLLVVERPLPFGGSG